MTTVLLTLVTIGLSAAAVAHLAHYDPKRRRAFAEPVRDRSPRRAAAWTLAYVPGLLLLVFDQWGAFMMWIGGAPLMSWAIASRRPDFYRRSCSWFRSLRQQGQRLRQMEKSEFLRLLKLGEARGIDAKRHLIHRVAELEARVSKLERLLQCQYSVLSSQDVDNK